jgi:acylphosphatase
VCRQFRIAGRVQGVFFRDSTRSEARRLLLAGYVHNLSSGDVDVRLCGSVTGMEEMIEWLNIGPPMAIVEHVAEEFVACTHPVGFGVA